MASETVRALTERRKCRDLPPDGHDTIGDGKGDMLLNVTDWLRGLGLEQYAHSFHENDVDAKVLPELTAEDLMGLGVQSIGHRRRLLAEIAVLRSAEPSASTELPKPPAVVPGQQPGTAERRQL